MRLNNQDRTKRRTGYGQLLYQTYCQACGLRLPHGMAIVRLIEHLTTCEGPIVQSFRLNTEG